MRFFLGFYFQFIAQFSHVNLVGDNAVCQCHNRLVTPGRGPQPSASSAMAMVEVLPDRFSQSSSIKSKFSCDNSWL